MKKKKKRLDQGMLGIFYSESVCAEISYIEEELLVWWRYSTMDTEQVGRPTINFSLLQWFCLGYQ